MWAEDAEIVRGDQRVARPARCCPRDLVPHYPERNIYMMANGKSHLEKTFSYIQYWTGKNSKGSKLVVTF